VPVALGVLRQMNVAELIDKELEPKRKGPQHADARADGAPAPLAGPTPGQCPHQTTHTPCWQREPPAQGWLQPPQCFGSEARSRQRPSQTCMPVGHTVRQVPAAQVCPSSQA
jgi:hypothetical protein